MIRKLLIGLLLLVILGIVAFLIFGPAYVERSMNKIDGKELPEIRADALALHKTLTIVDLHSDSLMWDRDISERNDRGQMDLPRLQDGNVTLQIFSSVTKTPKNQNYDNNTGETDNITSLVIAQLQPVRTWNSLVERSLYHAQKLDRAAAASDGQAMVVRGEEQRQRLACGSEKSKAAGWRHDVGRRPPQSRRQARKSWQALQCGHPHGWADAFL